MSTDQTWQINSEHSANTEQVAEKLAASLRGGEIIELISDLGGGKTTFVRGLARGLGSADHVSSPTFKISNVYQGKKLTLYHYDFYRLADDHLIQHELADARDDPKGVVVIEWGERISKAIPKSKITVKLKRVSDDEREMQISASPGLEYIGGTL